MEPSSIALQGATTASTPPSVEGPSTIDEVGARSAPNALTVLASRTHRLTKRWVRQPDGSIEVEEYPKGATFFLPIPVLLANLEDLSRLLSGLEPEQNSFVIRGALQPQFQRGVHVPRRKNPPHAAFDEVPRHPFMLDLDKIPCGLNPAQNPLSAVEFARQLLPAELRDASFHWQFGASQNRPDRPGLLSLRLWFWSDRPVGEAELKAWGDAVNEGREPRLIDTALFQTVQPHYTARPIFEGCSDPLVQRSGFFKGSRGEVTLPNGVCVTLPRRAISANPTRSPAIDVVIDHQTGKVTNGREGVLFRLARDIVHDRLDLDPEQLTHLVWQEFERKCDLSDGKWTIRKAADKVRAQLNRRSAKIVEGVDPHHQLHELPAPEVGRRLADSVADFFARPLDELERPRALLLALPAGVGKTTAVIDEIVRRPELKVAYFGDQHRLNQEVAAKLRDRGVDAVVIYGRTYKPPGAEHPLCRKVELVKAVAEAGLPVTSALCRRRTRKHGELKCEFYDDCAYIKQRVASARVRLFAHEHLTTQGWDGDPPDAVIIDERFVTKLARQMEMEAHELHLPTTVTVRAPELVHRTIMLVHEALVSSSDKRVGLLGELRRVGLTAEQAAAAAKLVAQAMGRMRWRIHPGLSAASQKNMAAEVRAVFKLFRFLNVLAAELETPRDEANRIQAKVEQTMFGLVTKATIRVFWSTPLRRLSSHPTPLLLIDADGNPDLLRRWFPELEVLRLEARRNAEVTQVSDSPWSRTKLGLVKGAVAADKHLRSLEALIEREAARATGKLLVVSYKPLFDKLKLPPGVAHAWFGSLLGLDQWKDFEEVIVIGREQPKIDELEATARSLVGEDDEPIRGWGSGPLRTELRGYTLSAGTAGSLVAVHPDARVQALLELSRERQVLQAIERIRTVHAGERKRVIVVTNLVLPIRVDRLVTSKDLLEQDLMLILLERCGGVLPLSAKWLYERFPEFFTSDRGAEHWIAGLNDPANTIEIIYSNHRVIQGRFRVKGQRGRSATRVLIRGEVVNPRAALEALLGEPVVKFELPKPRLVSDATSGEGRAGRKAS
jgi:hypothetical protein